ncbi:MAG: hypothetical protein LJE95_11695 [Acidobacteria bacterium]|nr:hypothetical protein [Acidobacteriota bacterium]
MGQLTTDQMEFLARRRRLARWWPVVGSLLLVVVVASVVWLFVRHPLLINPLALTSRVQAGTLPDSSLVILAVMLPVMSLACFIVLTAVILYGFSFFAIERRYQRLIKSVLEREPGGPGGRREEP